MIGHTIQQSDICPDTSDMNKKAKDWIENAIQQKNIKSIPWSELEKDSEIGSIGSGSFGSVFKAYWKSSHRYVAYKKLKALSEIQCNKSWKEFKHELYMQTRAHGCENIIQILGISKSKFLKIILLYTNKLS